MQPFFHVMGKKIQTGPMIDTRKTYCDLFSFGLPNF